MLTDHAASRGAGGNELGAARGGPGEVQREASVDPDTVAPVDCGTFLLAVTESLFRCLASCRAGLPLLPLLALQQRKSLRQRSWPCCGARIEPS